MPETHLAAGFFYYIRRRNSSNADARALGHPLGSASVKYDFLGVDRDRWGQSGHYSGSCLSRHGLTHLPLGNPPCAAHPESEGEVCFPRVDPHTPDTPFEGKTVGQLRVLDPFRFPRRYPDLSGLFGTKNPNLWEALNERLAFEFVQRVPCFHISRMNHPSRVSG